MSILALDFDGVICNGSHEVFVVGLQTYVDLVPRSAMAGHLQHLLAVTPLSSYRFDSDPLLRAFDKLTPLGNRAEDFGAAIMSLDQGIVIDSQEAYDVFLAEQDTEWLSAYHQRFYENRASLSTRDLAEWLRLMSPYESFLELLRRYAPNVTMAIATAKDGRSVRLLLEEFGISDLFPPQLLLDKDVGVRKTVHLQQLARLLSAECSEITFVDDKVNHLQRVAPLGVRCVLAAWGYNDEREHRLARRHGFEIATLQSAEEIIFGQPGDHSPNRGPRR
jgi:phosphoglycolate phosphatase-like HAD superfamily hydrolase